MKSLLLAFCLLACDVFSSNIVTFAPRIVFAGINKEYGTANCKVQAEVGQYLNIYYSYNAADLRDFDKSFYLGSYYVDSEITEFDVIVGDLGFIWLTQTQGMGQ